MVIKLNMKKIIYTIVIMIFTLANSGCKHKDIFNEVEFNVSTDPSNTYQVGDTVKFNFTGNVDNIVVYDGKKGHAYKNKDLYTYPVEDIESCMLNIEVSKRTSSRPHILKAFISRSFEGLKGPSIPAIEEEDKLLLQNSIVDGAGVWTELDFPKFVDAKFVSIEVDITDYKERFSLGFEWKTLEGDDIAKGQCAYQIKTSIDVEFNNGNPPMTISALQMRFSAFRLEDEAVGERYITGNVPGLSRYNVGDDLDIIFVGAGDTTKLKYSVNNWAISYPSALNPREADAGEVIKTFKDDLLPYSVIFKDAGTYTVTFVAGTTNYVGSGSVVREMEITIIDPVV